MSVMLSGLLLGLAVAALLWAEIKNSRAGVWMMKPVASTLFVVTALMAGALDWAYGQLILLGLLLSWLGDVLLIPDRQFFFIAGLVSFLLAHVAFSGAFYLHSLDAMYLSIASLIMLIVAVIVIRWLWPHLPQSLRAAVIAYMGAISLMVILAAGAANEFGTNILIGAALFAVSDLFVARERFVVSSIVNKLWGLPLYYAAQFIFALSVAGSLP
ncbi:MAG: lysoplasmalogenase family protein [Woeseiaceae bacterium]